MITLSKRNDYFMVAIIASPLPYDYIANIMTEQEKFEYKNTRSDFKCCDY